MATITRMVLESAAPFHFGKRGVGLNETEITLPADSLFSAFCNAFQMVRGAAALQTLLDDFPVYASPTSKTPPFRITSLMPTVNGIDLLPMPLLRPKLAKIDGVALRKQLKEIAWVSRTVFQKLITGQDLSGDDSVVEQHGERLAPYTVQAGAVWLSRDEYDQLDGEKTALWKVETRPRVTIDRISTAATAFSSGGVYFTDTQKIKVSLYCLIRWETADSGFQQMIEQVFKVLGESGVGGERSYGYGQFQPSFTPINDDLGVAQGEYFTTLSPYLPQPTERAVFAPPARYSIVLRRGWMSLPGYSNLRRPTVRMIDTGAVLHQLPGQVVVGALADATPDILQQPDQPTVYRYGLAWPVSVAAAALGDDRGGNHDAQT